MIAHHGLTADEVPAPTEGVLATWNLATAWANTGWHYWTDASQVSKLQSFLTEQNVHLVNEAYSATPSWAEGAILMADNMIEELYDLPPPHSPVDYLARNYVSEVWADAPSSGGYPDICDNTCMRNGSPITSFVRNGVCNDGGEGSTQQVCDFGTDCGDCGPRPAADAPGAALAEDPACFLGHSRLLLADGSRIALSTAEVGMQVRSALGVGTITDVLKHPIHSVVRRFRLPTEHGPLYGTPDHPVHVAGQWLEAAEAHKRGLLPGLQVELEVVDFFYNLEVDGAAAAGESHHSFDLNGLTVSGLGDSPRLNALYQRQSVFKQGEATVAPTKAPAFDAELETRGLTSGANVVRIASVPVLNLNVPPHNLLRCAVWDHIADGAQTCGSKVQWWINSYRYSPERAMLAVSQRFEACAACRPPSAADEPRAMPPAAFELITSKMGVSKSSSVVARRRQLQSATCEVSSLCGGAPPPPADYPCESDLCGNDDDCAQLDLCGSAESDCADTELCGDESECGDLCGDSPPPASSPPPYVAPPASVSASPPPASVSASPPPARSHPPADPHPPASVSASPPPASVGASPPPASEGASPPSTALEGGAPPPPESESASLLLPILLPLLVVGLGVALVAALYAVRKNKAMGALGFQAKAMAPTKGAAEINPAGPPEDAPAEDAPAARV